ncbi:unnamed protein product [Adineta steineri]|uniref:G-protein coupled receptors family 1 profile domain-containing protein n=1 Tax=Adineta steineri TaxID=433720 RepID=A0A814F2G1_9BILA|nr:unnamed protein product [Adineta steineri]CAF1098408.1 unnamed protein product [Adineta steineri]
MPTILDLKFALKEVTAYFGLFILIIGIIGGILNIIIFTTLKTFRETTCAFYLTFASIVGMGQLLTALFVRILSDGFSIDPRPMLWFCKTYFFASNWCLSVWLTSMCLATIDQVLSMSKYRHLSNLRLAQRFILIACIFWFIHSLFTFIYWDTSSSACAVFNPIYSIYFSHFTLPVLYGCLPLSILIIFSVLAFYKARTLASQNVNVVRLSRDRQLTAMLLVYIGYIVIAIIPFTSFYIYILNIYTTDPFVLVSNGLIFTITILIEYSMYSVAFYIYCCASERFRKQLVHVLGNIFFGRWQHWINRRNNNQVLPIITIDVCPTNYKPISIP